MLNGFLDLIDFRTISNLMSTVWLTKFTRRWFLSKKAKSAFSVLLLVVSRVNVDVVSLYCVLVKLNRMKDCFVSIYFYDEQ